MGKISGCDACAEIKCRRRPVDSLIVRAGIGGAAIDVIVRARPGEGGRDFYWRDFIVARELQMGTVPKKAVERVQFYENHITPFTTNATAIGITSAEATDLGTKTTAARAAFVAQQEAAQSSKVATEAFQNAVDAMSVTGAGLIKKIRAKAEMTNNPDVYTLAEIPAPPTPSPRPAPGTPSNFTATLKSTGELDIAWKCENPAGSAGTLYQVWRQIGEAGALEYLGGAGLKKFLDNTLPAGSNYVMYQIQGVRSSAVGDFGTFTVRFGVGTGGGATIASVTEGGTPAKLAA